MRRRRGPSGPDIRDVKPTRVIMDIGLSIDGGTIGLSKELDAVLVATVRAFEVAAYAQGLGFAWSANVRCVMPKRMDARIAKQALCIEQPPSDPARFTPSEVGKADGSASDRSSSLSSPDPIRPGRP